MTDGSNTSFVTTVPEGIGDAVGVGKRMWFVAVVNYNTEKKSSERLEKQGYECFVATQEEMKVWKNGRKAKVVRVVIPSNIFIKCTERERRQIVNLPYINRFMTNKAGATLADSTRSPLAVIPEQQIDTLRFMLGHSDTPVTVSSLYQRGDKVRVLRGGLKGLEGEVISTSDGKSELIVCLDFFGCARLSIDPVNVELIK